MNRIDTIGEKRCRHLKHYPGRSHPGTMTRVALLTIGWEMIEGSQVTDLMSTIHRLEAKVDVALTQTQATVAEQGRLINKLDNDLTGATQRVTALETVGAATALHLATLDRVTDKPRVGWQSTVGTIVSVLTFIMFIAALLYLGPTSP